MSHQSKIIYLVQLENVKQTVAKRLTLEIFLTETAQKCYLTLQVPYVEYTRHAKTMFKGSHYK